MLGSFMAVIPDMALSKAWAAYHGCYWENRQVALWELPLDDWTRFWFDSSAIAKSVCDWPWGTPYSQLKARNLHILSISCPTTAWGSHSGPRTFPLRHVICNRQQFMIAVNGTACLCKNICRLERLERAVERLRNAVGYVKRLERNVARLQALNFQSTCWNKAN
jgi:hypothetical protein